MLPGHHLLERRAFLSHMLTGASGLALTSLLDADGLLAADKNHSTVPPLHPETPLAARPPRFTPKAKRVLHVFCTGAVSHLDTWDYKPELIKRHGQPMPGVDKLSMKACSLSFAMRTGSTATPARSASIAAIVTVGVPPSA